MVEQMNEVAQEVKSEFDALVESYLEDFHSRHPTSASLNGLHTWDAYLEDFSREAFEDEARAARQFAERFSRINADLLDLSDQLDRQFLLDSIQARLHEIEELRFWQKNPHLYSETLATGLMHLMLFDRNHDKQQMQIAAAKLRQVPRLIESARRNIENPPPIFLKVARQSITGVLWLIEKDLPSTFATRQGYVSEEYLAATATSTHALKSYLDYIESVLTPRASGEFAIERKAFEQKLRYEEGVSASCDELIALGLSALEQTQEAFREAAARLDASADPISVWQQIKREHPREGELVQEAQAQLQVLIRFIQDHQIVTIPISEPVVVARTPDAFRWSFASLWPPGAFEERSLHAHYFITDVDPSWTEEQKEEHLTYFAYPALWMTSIHEAYPGHFVQFAHLKRVRSKPRKVLGIAPSSYVEGWAHYVEQMMVDEGFGDGDPKIKLGQLLEALLRLCRYLVAIKLHTEGMTIEEATRFFMENAYLEEMPARAEAERGTFDPGYLAYTLGKFQIQDLRDRVRQVQGTEFSLSKFHDQLLGLGMAPLWLHRCLMTEANNQARK
jgi:uncharacterized protein (DUF885 family)